MCCQEPLEDQGVDEEQLDPWHRLIHWFSEHPDFVEAAYVCIDKLDESMEGGCVYPRLMIGRLRDGGITGLFGVVVYT